jgi:hypothetical protein
MGTTRCSTVSTTKQTMMNITKKIQAQGGQMSEQSYRSIRDRLSYSSIKLFDNSRKDFYQQLVLGEKRAEKGSIAVTMGSLVHLLDR